MQSNNRLKGSVFLISLRRLAQELPPVDLTPKLVLHLLMLDGTEFVRQAYTSILHRQADENALTIYGRRGRTLIGRILILFSLFLSPERVALPAPVLKTLKALKKLAGG